MSTTAYGGANANTAIPSAKSTGNPLSQNITTSIGLGYAIVIALGFLLLLSTFLLASYICCRASRRRHHHFPVSDPNNRNPNRTSDGGIILPRIIFVAEDDENRSSDNLVVGLEQSVINSYPKFPFSKSKDASDDASSSCSICLCDYKEGEMLRMMPDCRHFFHLYCLDAWLRLNGSCPICRNSPLPTPLSTPLSEVVPLSQYAGGRRR